MNNVILVENLGLTDKEAAVYTAVLELGSSTIQPIAKRAGVKRTSIYYFIDHLVELGLIEQLKIRGRMHYKARPPEQMLSLQKQRLEEIKNALPGFQSIFNQSTRKPRMSYYEGPEQMKNIMLEELRHKEIRFIWPIKEIVEMIGGPDFMADLVRQIKKRGIRVKTLRFPEQEVAYEGSTSNEAEDWREIRYAPAGTTFPLAIGIYDQDTVAFLSSRKEGFGILIESTELAQGMTILFEMFWAKAKNRPR
ncbi:MAG: hypothetical protein NUV80_06865 [Candidatus Berkelbacteria bacterium]|nr:hypothetical protein [Candidatus Berkelbacteria bacterium]MCR4308252.1 hypothetical protein [Candidatus Berkelbacteria bacterium]